MALLESTWLPLGIACPDFSLPGIDGLIYSQKDFSKEQGLLVMFLCNHCPYVRAVEDRLIELRRSFTKTDLAMVGICSNDAKSYPDDQPDELKKRWLEKNYDFPYLIDEAQTAAKAFSAVCTPDLFLFDQERKLYYHGRLDDNWQDGLKVRQEDLKNAISALLSGEAPSVVQMPSIGCSIKWR